MLTDLGHHAVFFANLDSDCVSILGRPIPIKYELNSAEGNKVIHACK